MCPCSCQGVREEDEGMHIGKIKKSKKERNEEIATKGNRDKLIKKLE
jgi:hypothetical protein